MLFVQCPVIFQKATFWWLLSFLGFLLLSFCYILAWRGNDSDVLYLLGNIVAFVPLLCALLVTRSKVQIILLLFVLGLMIYSVGIFRSPNYFVDRDEMGHYQEYTYIIENGHINMHATVEPVFAEYPGLELEVASWTIITGLKSIVMAKILVGIAHSLCLLALWIAYRWISSSEDMASVATFIYAVNPRYLQFDTMISYESLGLVFFLLLFLIMVRMIVKGRSVRLFAAFLVLLCAITITHHLSSFMFLLLGIVVSITCYVISEQQTTSPNVAPLTAVVIIGWLIYVAHQGVAYLSGIVMARILAIFQLSFFGGTVAPVAKIVTGTFGGQPVPGYEQFLVKYLYPPVLFFVGVYGAYCLLCAIKTNNSMNKSIKLSLIIYGPVLFILSWPLILTSGSELTYRLWGFFLVGMAYVMAYALLKLYQGRMILISIVAILLISLGGVSLARNNSQRFPGSTFKDVEAFYDYADFSAANWFGAYVGHDKHIAGIFTTQDVFGSYGRESVDVDAAARLLVPDYSDKNVIDVWRKTPYLVEDWTATTTIFSSGKNYWGPSPIADTEPYVWYGFNKPLPVKGYTKFGSLISAFSIYDNGTILLYANSHYIL